MKRLLLLYLLLSIFISANLYADKNIVVVYSDSTKYTLRTISGLNWSITNEMEGCHIEYCYLGNSPGGKENEIKSMSPDVLVTIGTNATEFCDINFPDISIVFAKVLNPIESGFIESWESPGGHLTGASLDIPVKIQMERFKSILPNLKTIGLIYTSKTSRLAEEAIKAASELNIQFVTYNLSSARDLPLAVDSLCKSVDGIWTVADEQIWTPQIIRYALLESLRNGIPLMGFSRSFVESGALFCLEADYKYIGRQAAETVRQVINGGNTAEISTTVPDIFYLYLNLKTEKRLNLKVPAELVDIAKETY